MRNARTALRISVIAVVAMTVPFSAAEEPPAGKAQASATAIAEKPPAKQNTPAAYKIRGHCVDRADNSSVASVRVLLFELAGRTGPMLQSAETTTDAKGDYEFSNLAPPRDTGGLDRLEYKVLIVDPNWSIGMGFFVPPFGPVLQTWLIREQGRLTGKVVNSRGQPVAGAIVAGYSIDGRTIPGILSAPTGTDGRFSIEKIPVQRKPDGTQLGASFRVIHPDYPETIGRADELPADVTVTVTDGCTVTGRVIDAVTGKPAANALITSQLLKQANWQETFASTDARGHFHLALPEGRYHFLAEGPDRVSVALTDRECVAGQSLELPPIKLIAGGLDRKSVV